MKVIGRKSEQKALYNCDRSKKSELVCVYGRRRVGKTFLIEQTFADYFTFRATGLENGNTRQQLKAFHQRLTDHGDTVKTIPANWFEAFSRLHKLLYAENAVLSPHGKRIIFLDEFPWFATPKSDFLLAFEEFWNRCGTQHGDMLFIICGSATSWIINNIIDNTGSLFHRVTSQIFITPFTLYETERFFYDREFRWTREQIAECYMIFGGLPFFMELLNNNESLSQNITRLLFKQDAILKDETNRLLESTLRSNPLYGQILELLSTHNYGMKKLDCQNTLNAPNGSFFRAIDDLVKCGYIREYKQYYEKGNPYYVQLTDLFLLFHYHFLSNDSTPTSYEELKENMGTYHNWRGHAFEILCLNHIPQIKKALGIAGVKTNTFQWANFGEADSVQIDLVIERADNITNICEMKYTNSPFVMKKEYELSLLNKVAVFREKTDTDKALKIVLVSAAGISGVAHTEHISEVITLDDLFEN